MGKISDMGIRRKVTLGCIVLALVLFISSLIAVFEFRKMDDFVKKVIDGDIEAIQRARGLYYEAQNYNNWLMAKLGSEEGPAALEGYVGGSDMRTAFGAIHRDFDDKWERAAVDSITFAYAAYMQIVAEAPTVWQQEPQIRSQWYYSRLQPVYGELRRYIEQLVNADQDALIGSSQSLQGSFHRSIMPSIVAMLLGLAMVALFHYYLMHYLVRPLLKVNKGLAAFRQWGKNYDVQTEGFDEINEINTEIKNVLEINRAQMRQMK